MFWASNILDPHGSRELHPFSICVIYAKLIQTNVTLTWNGEPQQVTQINNNAWK